MSKERFNPNETIESISIPDDDAHEWMRTLHEAGFDMDEIDQIMTWLNDTYAHAHPELSVEQHINALEQDEKERDPSFPGFSAEEREALRESMLEYAKRQIAKKRK